MALALAEPAAPAPLTLEPPMFIERPSPMDLHRAMDRHLSPKAFAYRGPLHATLSCAVKKDGSLEACEIIEETPPGLGVGQVALRLSREFRLPTLIGGQSVEGGHIKIPLGFAPR